MKKLTYLLIILFYFQGIYSQILTGISNEPATSNPQVRHLYAVAPNVLTVRVEEKDFDFQGITTYSPEAGDEIKTGGYYCEPNLRDIAGVAEYAGNGLFREIHRDGSFIGYLVGSDKNLIANIPDMLGEALNYPWLLDTLSYLIKSPDDLNFATSVNPIQVYRKRKPREGAPNTQAFNSNFAYVQDLYLVLPDSMEKGRSYTVEFLNSTQLKDSVTFIFDERYIRSEAVQVNQNGYSVDQEKKAFLSTWMGSGGGIDYSGIKHFQVIDTSGVVLYQGAPRKKENLYHSSDLTRSPVYELDFSPLTTPGMYRVVVPGVGSSFDFKIVNSVWLDAAVIQHMGILHQRAGIEINTLPTPHPEDLTEAQGFTVYHIDSEEFYSNQSGTIFSRMQKALQKDSIHTGVYGGWRDAMDFDRQVGHMSVVGIMCNLWEMNPDYFEALKLPVPEPEASNNIPDILDEAIWGTSLFLREQTEEGEVPSFIESIEHPRAGESQWTESLPGCWVPGDFDGAFNYAAHAAYLSWALQSYDTTMAREFRESALLAYQWTLDNPDHLTASLELANQNRYRSLFGALMFRISGEEQWQELFKRYTNKSGPFHEEIAYINTNQSNIDVGLQEELKNNILSSADRLVEKAPGTVYESLRSGSNATHELTWPENVSVLIYANMIKPSNKYIRAIENSYLFTFGANPQNLSYLTGVGNRTVFPDDMNYIWREIPNKPVGIQNPGYKDDFDGDNVRNAPEYVQPVGTAWPDAEYHFPRISKTEHTVGQLASWGFHGLAALSQFYGFINDSVQIGNRYTLSVTKGTGTGTYPKGYSIEIIAEPAPEGMIFDKWMGDTLSLDTNYISKAWVNIPDSSISLTATYKVRPPEYLLSVKRGIGDSSYFAGSRVEIRADKSPLDSLFHAWVGDTSSISDNYSRSTSLIMPDSAISITATYKKAPPMYLLKAFAFGGDEYTTAVYSDPRFEYIKVVNGNRAGNLYYDENYGYGYTLWENILDGYSGEKVNTVSCEIYDQFIGTGQQGDTAVFRVDVPNGDYKFQIASGFVIWGHYNNIVARDGASGETVSLVDQKLDKGGSLASVEFEGRLLPPCEDVAFVEQPESPLLTVTENYIDFFQICNNWWGGDLVILEIWDMDQGPHYTLTTSSENGQIHVNPLYFNYKPGTEVTLTAIPDEGYEFKNWSGDISTIEDSLINTTINKNVTVRANFKKTDTGVKRVGSLNPFKLYPNPVNDYLMIENLTKGCNIRIISVTGKVYLTKVANSNFEKLYLHNLPNGVFIVQIHAHRHVYNYKIVK